MWENRTHPLPHHCAHRPMLDVKLKNQQVDKWNLIALVLNFNEVENFSSMFLAIYIFCERLSSSPFPFYLCWAIVMIRNTSAVLEWHTGLLEVTVAEKIPGSHSSLRENL